MAGLHRNLTLLALVFVAAHVVTTVADGFAPIGLLDAVVPFVSPYRPIWLGLGAVAFDLLLALVVTSLLRARIGYRSWRVVHWLAYAAWPVALVHALGTGSDARIGWFALLGFGCAGRRRSRGGRSTAQQRPSRRSPRRRGRRNRRRRADRLPLVPRRPGTAGLGGTGRDAVLDPSPARGASDDGAGGARRTTFSTPFAASLDARLAQSRDASGDVGIAIAGNVRGSHVLGILHLTLWGTATARASR